MHALRWPHPIWMILIIIPVVVFASNKCSERTTRISINDANVNGSRLQHENETYPEGTYWKEVDHYHVCICDQKPCNFIASENERSLQEKSSHPKHSNVTDTVERSNETSSIPVDLDTANETNTEQYNPMSNDSIDVTEGDVELKTTDNVETELSNTIPTAIPPQEEDTSSKSSSTTKITTKKQTDAVVTVTTTEPKATPTSSPMIPKADKRKEQASISIGIGIVHLISIVSLIFLLYAYRKIDEMRFLRGKCIECLAICLLIYSIGMFAEFMGLAPSSKWPCPIFGMLSYFGSLCVFFWLNVLCFDAFLIGFNSEYFKTMPISTKFTNFSLYCWPISILLSLLVLVMSVVLNKNDTMSPGIGTSRCSLNPSNTGTFIYYHIIVIFTMVSNVIFFAYTKRNLRKTEDTAFESQKRKLMTYAKLFVVLGFIWLLEFIEWSTGPSAGFAIFVQFLNAVRGLLVLTACFFTNERAVSLFKKMRNPNQMDLDGFDDEPADGGENGEQNVVQLRAFNNDSVNVGMATRASHGNSSEGLLSIVEEDDEKKAKGSKADLLNENETVEGHDAKEHECIGDLDELLTLGEALKPMENCKLRCSEIVKPEAEYKKVDKAEMARTENEKTAEEARVATENANSQNSSELEESTIGVELEQAEIKNDNVQNSSKLDESPISAEIEQADIEKSGADQLSVDSLEAINENEKISEIEQNNVNIEILADETSKTSDKNEVEVPSKEDNVTEP